MSKKDEEKNSVKMSGYLEKKGNKMKVMSSWKLKWFVLKGRLLLYYRSKDEYEALSPCKGSINLGPACSVKPLLGASCLFQIETRARTIVLKAKSRLDQEKWLQAILSVLNQNVATPTTGIVHFRYSSDDLVPRRIKDTGRSLTRQNTMPERHKVEKRQTFCGSFENVLHPEPADIKPKYSSTHDVTSKNVYGAINKPVRKSEEIVNDLYGAVNKVKKLSESKPLDNENLYYRISSDSNDSTKGNLVENENYIKGTRKPKENIYSKITCDYVTQKEMDENERGKETIVENDQYCTSAIRVVETKELKYHEYTLPQNDNIYSVPNVDQNENRIPKYDAVGPYSICDIYPKKQRTEEVIYDSPLEVLEREPSKEGKVEELVKKYEDERKPQLPKKMSFLKKFFKLRNRKKSDSEVEEAKSVKEDVNKLSDCDLINRNVLEELQKLLMAKKESLQHPQVTSKPDSSLAMKQMLEELQKLLVTKKENLKVLTDTSNPLPPLRKEESIYQEISDLQPERPNIMNANVEHMYENTSSNALLNIDKILSDLDNMKKASKPVTTSKVKNIIAKFNSLEIADIKEVEDEEPVVLRKKRPDFVSVYSSGSTDDLNLLLSELTKVTSAPILTPGVTSSLDVAPLNHEDEFQSVDDSKKRRYSDPDYDVPRPHTNLNIVKPEKEADDAFVATRFFGPVLSNFERGHSTSTSITPDSLEVTPCTSEVGSYQSHAYGKIKQKPYFLHDQPKSIDSENKETFEDSLDNSISTAL